MGNLEFGIWKLRGLKAKGSKLKAQGKRGWWDLNSESGMRNDVKRSWEVEKLKAKSSGHQEYGLRYKE